MKETILAQHPDGRIIEFSPKNWNLLGVDKSGFQQISRDVPEEVKEAIGKRKAPKKAAKSDGDEENTD